MIERAGAGISRRAAMEREIVASGTEIGVVRIGLPHEAHAEDARIKLRCAIDVGNAQSQMAQSAIANHIQFLDRGFLAITGTAQSGSVAPAETAIDDLYLLKRGALGKVVAHQVDPLLLARIAQIATALVGNIRLENVTMNGAPGFQHAPDIGEDLDRMRQILHRDGHAPRRRTARRRRAGAECD